ncbi:unnamed protein product, partial [Owenia fusiformis]
EKSSKKMSIAFLLLCIGSVLVSGFPSTKKGVCVSPKGYQCTDLEQFSDLVWWYDWSLKPAYKKRGDCTNVPIQERVAMKKAMAWPNLNIPNGTKYLLGFNEPNVIDQANMTPQEAANYWPQIEAAATSANVDGLVSPSATYCGGGSAKCITQSAFEWFDEFFAICSNCRVDYVATHHYTCDPVKTMDYLAAVYAAYGKQIWLTEFACPSNDFTTVSNYMSAVLPLLEEAPYVFRYSWYTTRISNSNAYIPPMNALLESGGTGLTALGQIYDSFQPA